MKYVPRTIAPINKDKNYIKTTHGGYNYCIEIKNGSCLPNCVGYAWGRRRELLKKYHALSRGNAEVWYRKNDGFERGQIPKLGAIACWEGKGSLAGHVACVERVFEDKSFTCSNSGYSGRLFWMSTHKPPYNIGKNYVFQGFIYMPVEYDDKPDSKKEIYQVLSPRYIRTSASMNGRVKMVKECTNAMKNALISKNSSAKAQIKKNIKITSLGLVYESNGRVWLKNYSGYVCVKGKNGDVFCKKV